MSSVEMPPSLRLRPMSLDDLDAVFAIEQLVYPTPFTQKGYRHELTQNRNASYAVLEPCEPFAAVSGLLGYVGHWVILDEGHISVISVHPSWQGNRLGELLFVYALRDMVARQCMMATLEVRESNLRAQRLYQKFRFDVVGRRKRYYRDTGEDGLIMTAEPLDAGYSAWLEGAWEAVCRGISAKIIINTPTDNL